jgi:hypothetical protein
MANADPNGPYEGKQFTADGVVTPAGQGGYLKSVILNVATAAGIVIIKDGGASGTIKVQLDLDAATARNSIAWDGGPVRFDTDIYCDLTGSGAKATVVFCSDSA